MQSNNKCLLTCNNIENKIEREMCKHLQTAGVAHMFCYQYRIDIPGTYTISDFACEFLKLAIYCDGFVKYRGFSYKEGQKNFGKDRQQDNELQLMGWRVARFSGIAILNNPKYCISTIKKHIEQREKEFKAKESAKVKIEAIISDPTISENTKISRIINTTGAVCGALALQPLPFADIFVITPVQIVMVSKIAQVKGFDLAKYSPEEIFIEIAGMIGVGLLAQQGVIGLTKLLIPFLGGTLTVPLVWGATYGIGKAASLYFDMKKSGKIDIKAVKAAYNKGYKEGGSSYKNAK